MITTVIFDFGQTLFDWRSRDRTETAIASGIAALLGLPRHECDRVAATTATVWPAILERSGYPMGELDLVDAMREVFAAAAIPLGRDAVADLIREEHATWPAERVFPAEVRTMLAELSADGIRIAICSNTIDPVENCHLDLRMAGLDGVIAASVFSTEVGARKPNPAIYAAVLSRLGNPDPSEVLFVGDRVLEDVTAPATLGMRSCLATWFRNENPATRPRARTPGDVVALVRRLNGPTRAIA